MINKLFNYQQEAVDKLMKIKVGALFMEQGTGKTITTLALVKARIETEKIDRAIWLCPFSIKQELKNEIIKHMGEFPKYITICGIQTLSTSFKTIGKLNEICENQKVFLIVDESSLVKNHFAKRTKNIQRLGEKSEYRLILNGTPIGKCEADLFAQFYILDKRILGYNSYWSFAANHLEFDENTKQIRNVLNIDYLIEKIKPYTFQILKKDCLDLPCKWGTTNYCNLTEWQAIEYDRVMDLFLDDVSEFVPSTLYRLFTALQRVVSGNYIVSKLRQPLKCEKMFENPLDNPRIQTLLETIQELEGKIIIFAKFSDEIEDIQKVLQSIYGNDSVVTYYGKNKAKQRYINLKKFETIANFMIANKACGCYGLNLQYCSNVIFYSNDWDLLTREQAEDRLHRVGQVNSVHIVDICAESKIDKRILSCLVRKEHIADAFKKELKKQGNLKTWLNGG